jgi:hypothetical protein
MQKALGVAAIALSVPAAVLSAQQFRENVASGQPTRYEPPRCGIKPGHFLVSSASTKLSVALGGSAANRERLLREGVEVLNDAITTKGQDKNPAAWYWLGRIDLYRGFRRPVGRTLIGAGLTYYKDSKPDSAQYALRLAARMPCPVPEAKAVAGRWMPLPSVLDGVLTTAQSCRSCGRPLSPSSRGQAAAG